MQVSLKSDETRITGTLHEDLCTLFIMSRSFLLMIVASTRLNVT